MNAHEYFHAHSILYSCKPSRPFRMTNLKILLSVRVRMYYALDRYACGNECLICACVCMGALLPHFLALVAFLYAIAVYGRRVLLGYRILLMLCWIMLRRCTLLITSVAYVICSTRFTSLEDDNTSRAMP
jgi:hypothetical protein